MEEPLIETSQYGLYCHRRLRRQTLAAQTLEPIVFMHRNDNRCNILVVPRVQRCNSIWDFAKLCSKLDASQAASKHRNRIVVDEYAEVHVLTGSRHHNTARNMETSIVYPRRHARSGYTNSNGVKP